MPFMQSNQPLFIQWVLPRNNKYFLTCQLTPCQVKIFLKKLSNMRRILQSSKESLRFGKSFDSLNKRNSYEGLAKDKTYNEYCGKKTRLDTISSSFWIDTTKYVLLFYLFIVKNSHLLDLHSLSVRKKKRLNGH